MNRLMCTWWGSARFIVAALVFASVCALPAMARAGASEDAVRRVSALMNEQQWGEALDLLEVAPIRESTRESLIGVIAMRTGAHARAIESFERALELGPKRERLYLYLAWSHYSLGARAQARKALAHVESDQAREPFYWLLQGRFARDTNDLTRAYEVLLKGHTRFPGDHAIMRELGFVLVQFGALNQARGVLVSMCTGDAENAALWSDATRLLRALSQRGDDDEALFYIEILRARLPDHSTELDVLAAHLHARARRPRAAAALFARATWRGSSSFAFEAADQYRVARMTHNALRWNGRVMDDDRRLSQRLLILSEDGRWERAAVTGRQIKALQGFKSQALRYRFGVALWLGERDLEGAREVVNKLGSSTESEQLNRLIEQCVDEPWSCR